MCPSSPKSQVIAVWSFFISLGVTATTGVYNSARDGALGGAADELAAFGDILRPLHKG